MSALELLTARSPLASQPSAAQGWSTGGTHLVERLHARAVLIALHQSPAERLPQLPADNAVTGDANFAVASCGPQRYLAVARSEDAAVELAALCAQLAGVAAIVEYGDQIAFMAIRGPNAALALGRLCSLDLESRSFPPLRAAVLRMESVRAILWREGRSECFVIGVQRSMAVGTWQALVEACESLVSQ